MRISIWTMTTKDFIKLFEAIPHDILAGIGEDTGIDKNVSRLYVDRMLKLLLLTMLRSDKPSTRIMETLYESPFFNAFSGKGGHKTRHSSLASRLGTMNPEYFRQIFEWVLAKHGSKLKTSKLFQRIRSYDSTMVSISSALVDWGMRVGRPPKGKAQDVQVKFTMSLYGKVPSSVKAHFNQPYLSEEKALKEAVLDSDLEPGDFVVFDRGMKSRNSFKLFDKLGIQFVTKASKNVRYQELETYRNIKGRQADDLEFIKDVKVYLYQDGHDILEHEFRLVVAKDLKTNRTLCFITNAWEPSAMDIARIYRRRWDIEVFFRFLKQQMNVKHLLNRSESGVQIQMYCALILAILLLVFKKKGKISSYKAAKLLFEEYLLMILANQLEKPPKKLLTS